jgi:hypothetical protein
MKTLKTFLATFITLALFAQLAVAAPLPALFYASTFDANVGDTVTFNLKVNPDPSKPVYTVGATLKYDPSMMAYQDATVDRAWMPLSKSPYELTDTSSGVITRTAGYPEGLKAVAPFTTYSFKALKPGDTKIVINEGMSLDAENNDSGLQAKTITIHIASKQQVVQDQTAPAPEETPAKKNVQQTITLDVKGQTAMYSTEDYSFSIAHNLKVEQPTTGTTSVSVYDQNGGEVYATTQNFNSSTTTALNYTIPANTLQPGDYSMVITTKHSDQKTPLSITKDLGVLAKADKVVEKNVEVPYIPLYVYAIFGILLIIIFLMYLHKRSKKFRNFLKNF